MAFNDLEVGVELQAPAGFGFYMVLFLSDTVWPAT